MGNSNSSSSQTIVNNTVNKTSFDYLNKNIINMGVETLQKTAQGCSQSINQSNDCNMKGWSISNSNNINLSSNQSNKADVNLSCIQVSEATSAMNNSMMTAMLNNLNTLNGTKSASELNSIVASQAKSGSMSLPVGSANSSDSSTLINNITNDTKVSVQNIFEQNLTNSLTQETVSECVFGSDQKNTKTMRNLDIDGSSNGKASCIQSNNIESVLKCKQLIQAVSDSTTKTIQDLGMKVQTTNLSGSDTEMKSDVKSEYTATGPFQDFYNGIGGIFKSLGGALSMGQGGGASIFIVICVIVIICIGGFIFMSSGSGGGGGGGSDLSNAMPTSGQLKVAAKYGKFMIGGGVTDSSYTDFISVS